MLFVVRVLWEWHRQPVGMPAGTARRQARNRTPAAGRGHGLDRDVGGARVRHNPLDGRHRRSVPHKAMKDDGSSQAPPTQFRRQLLAVASGRARGACPMGRA